MLPSYHEGMSNVLLEAAATGRPVITSNIPGCRESVENGKSGLLVEVKNKEMLYDAMKEMLHCSREEREQMGQAGREKMEREFRKEVVVEKTVQSLREDEKETLVKQRRDVKDVHNELLVSINLDFDSRDNSDKISAEKAGDRYGKDRRKMADGTGGAAGDSVHNSSSITI